MKKLYSNIGRKIKILAKIFGIGGAIIFLILGIIFSFLAVELWQEADFYWMLAIISYIMVPLPMILSLLLYGFGELIEKTSQIAAQGDDVKQ